MSRLGRLQKVELRDAWETEDRDFTPWLADEDNIKNLTLDDIEMEAAQ